MMAQNWFVMKCGGSTLAELPEGFFADLRDLQKAGTVPVIVHGGGPAINQLLTALEVETEFVSGLRKTDERVLEVVEMVLCGQINKQIVRRIAKVGGKAIGISGIDGGLIRAVPVANADQIGFVGDVQHVEADILRAIIEQGYMPVVAPLGIDETGQHYNINADTAAGAVASQLGVERMIVVTDVPGIMRTVNGEKQVMPVVTVEETEAMIASGEIYGGMIPKVRAAVQCIQGQVQEVVIVDGSEPNILSRVMNGEALGTRIVTR